MPSTSPVDPRPFGGMTLTEAMAEPLGRRDPHAAEETVLEEAQRLIYGDRAAEYGPASISMGRIAALWSIVLGHEVTADEAALCLNQLKVARAIEDTSKRRPIKRDTIVDMGGYAGVLGKLADEANSIKDKDPRL